MPPPWEDLISNPETKYFLVKSFQEEHVNVSKRHGAWATNTRNEKALAYAFETSPYVVLLFSVNGSGRFFGYAIMKSKPGESTQREHLFTTPDGRPFPGKLFDLEWISTKELSFRYFDGITNSLNENKAVKIGRDGQALSTLCGQQALKIYQELGLTISDQNPSNEKNPAFKPPPPPPPPPATKNETFGWNDIISANPACSIYPLDLTALRYEDYEQIYQDSCEEAEQNQPVVLKLWELLTTGHFDWTEAAVQSLGAATAGSGGGDLDHLVEQFLALARTATQTTGPQGGITEELKISE